MGFFKLKRRFLSRKIEIKNRVKKINDFESENYKFEIGSQITFLIQNLKKF